MHATLHTLFKSASFHYGSSCEPEGQEWIEVQQILRENLDPRSYSTVWKVLIHSKEMLSRAFNASAIASAYRQAGIVCPLYGRCSPEVIMSHCPHWTNLLSHDGQWVLNKIPEFTEIFTDNGYLPENSFELLQERPHVDNCPENGSNLNDFVTNRQRAMVLGMNNLRIHQLNRSAETQEQTRRTKSRTKCMNHSCMREQPAEGCNWGRCKVKKCRLRSCGLQECQILLADHEIVHRNLNRAAN
jgi:hypothetical protein